MLQAAPRLLGRSHILPHIVASQDKEEELLKAAAVKSGKLLQGHRDTQVAL